MRVLALAALLALAACAPEEGSAPQAITGVLLMDGTVRPPVANATVLIRRGKIEAMGPASVIRVPEGYHRIEARGRVLFPADPAKPLVAGGDADLLLLSVNPALDPDYSKKITGHMLAGRWVQFPQ